MTDSSQPDNDHPRSQQVNLQQIAQQFMAGLQRHFDMLAFNLAAREDVTEADYNKFVKHLRSCLPPNRTKTLSKCRLMPAIC